MDCQREIHHAHGKMLMKTKTGGTAVVRLALYRQKIGLGIN